MRLRHLILFSLIVSLPLGAAAWLGLKVAADEQKVSQHQFQTLLQGRLRDVASTIAVAIADIERYLVDNVIPPERAAAAMAAAETAPLDPPAWHAALREVRRSEPLIRDIFVVDPDGALVFPPEGATASAGERAFRERTAPIWRGEAVLYEQPAPEATPGPSVPMAVIQLQAQAPVQAQNQAPVQAPPHAREPVAHGDTLIALAKSREHGWVAWYWEEGLHLLFWRRTPEGGVIGVEIERIALIARIISKLPTTGLDDGRVVLSDPRGSPIHQWGPYEPSAGEHPVAQAAVPYPLSAWQLWHYASPAQKQAFFAGTLKLNLILGLSAVALALIAMAAYIYREYARKMRDATERVTFVTQVSHELKTPLTNIRLYAELLENDLFDEDDKVHRRLSVIIAESQRLTRLINNILTFSKNQRGSLDVHKAWISLDEVVRAVADQFGPALDAKGIERVLSTAAPEPVYADADLIGQIVANLLSNVEKYAASGRWVEIATEQREGSAMVRVTDRGPGIATAHREAVFRPFYRVSDKLADGVTGTGIGLAIARELARVHGGELRLLATASGACFELTIHSPAGKDKAGADAGSKERNEERS